MPFIDALQKIAPLSLKCQTELRVVMQLQSFKKGRSLVVPGQISDKLYYIESGLVRVFYDTDTDTDMDTREVTARFGQAGSFISSVESFLLQKPSFETVQVLEDSQLWFITYANLEQMYHQFPKLNFHFRKISQDYIIACEERMRLLRQKSADKQYAAFLKLYPNLINQVHVKYVAQYLNMASNTLSTARNKLKNKR